MSIRRILSIALIAAVVTAGFSGYAFAGAKYRFRLATLPPKGSTWMNTMEAMGEEIKEKSGGEIEFKWFPGGAMGDEKDYIKRMRVQIDGAGFSGMGLGEIVPASRIIELPFTYENYEEVDHVREALAPTFDELFEAKGYKIIGWAEQGFIYLFSNKEIRSVADVKASKCWAWQGDAFAAKIFDAFGVTPVPIPVPDVLTALQTGIVDTCYNSAYGLVALQWFTKLKFMSAFPLTYATGAMIVKKSKFDKLPPEYQTMVLEVSRKYMNILIERTRKDNADAFNTLQTDAGIKIIDLPEAEKAQFKEIGQTVRLGSVGTFYPAELEQTFTTTLQAFRDAQAKATP